MEFKKCINYKKNSKSEVMLVCLKRSKTNKPIVLDIFNNKYSF